MGDTLQILLDLNYTGLQQKIAGALGGIEKTFKSIDTEFDWSKTMNASYFNSINWTSLISKLFTPANLVAFFSAMAATGVIAGLTAQAAGTNAAASAGLDTGGASAGPAITSGALTAQDTLGGLVGSTSDVATALAKMTAYVEQFGGSATDAVSITTELGEALKATGGTFSQAFDTSLIQLLQNSGATTPDQIEQLISNVMSSSQASGGNLSMSDVVTQSQQLAINATKAGVGFDALNTLIVNFGASAKVSLQGAQDDMTVWTTALSGSESGITALADLGFGTMGNLVSGLNTNVTTTTDAINKKLSSMSQATAGAMAAAFGLPPDIAAATSPLVTMKGSIDDATASLTVFSGAQGIQLVNTEFQDSLSTLDQIHQKVQDIEDLFAKMWNASPGGFLLGLAGLATLSFVAVQALLSSALQLVGTSIGTAIAAGMGGTAAAGAGGVAAGAAETLTIGAIVASVIEILAATAAAAILGYAIYQEIFGSGTAQLPSATTTPFADPATSNALLNSLNAISKTSQTTGQVINNNNITNSASVTTTSPVAAKAAVSSLSQTNMMINNLGANFGL